MADFQNCPNCQKRVELCVCSQIQPLDSKIHILILQHPQEPDHELGSARIAHLALKNSDLRIGLSWRNLADALGRPASPANWAVLYLGSGVKSDGPTQPGLIFVSKKGIPVPRPEKLEGIVILDGTWSQAKALWWRNAWLLKCKRVILNPKTPSLYGPLRREPRKECLSTTESIAEVLSELGEPREIRDSLRKNFALLLEKYKGLHPGRRR
ncbi:MAG: DTW domain-containing protein [Bdellovibrio sp.]|nr:DTW domain-containing protein [Bdellovibrio sp.]